MNPVIETICQRRSIRRFLPDPVPLRTVETILEAGKCSPSSMNSQPWHFTVIDDSKMLDDISRKANQVRITAGMIQEILNDATNPSAEHIFYQAPLVIIVSGKNNTLSPDPNVDCALAAYTMSLAAASLGIGSCLIDLYNSFGTLSEASEMLKLPDLFKPYYGVALGIHDERYSPLAPLRRSQTITFHDKKFS